MRVRSALACLGAALLPLPAVPTQAGEIQPATFLAGASQPTTRIIVSLRPATGTAGTADRVEAQSAGTRHAALAAFANRHGLPLAGARTVGPRLHTLKLDAPLEGPALEAALAGLRSDPDVEFAEPDQRRFARDIPNDTLYPNQWYLQGTETAAVDAEAAWDITEGASDTVIAVLDTGVRFEHPDLGRVGQGGRLLPGYDFVSGEGGTSFLSANDGDDRDADPSDPGDWLSTSDLAKPTFANCDGPVESSWHGTRVAGMVGAIGNNGQGISGGTRQGQILPVRVLGKCGGFDSDILAAMRWAAGLHVDGVPDNVLTKATVINLSLGSPTRCSSGYKQVLTELTAAGVVVVASAGNATGPVESPANCPGVLAVAGVRHVGTKVGYSSFGAEVGISAPAGNCVNVNFGDPCLFTLDSTANDGLTIPGNSIYTDQFNYNVGTSFSAPVVTAIAGLMHGVNASLRPAELIARIKSGARAFPAPDPNLPTCPTVSNDVNSAGQCNCTTTTCGAGLANAPGAVDEALRPIARVADVGSVRHGEVVSLDGTESAAARDRAITAYGWTVVTPTVNPPAIAGASSAAASVTAPQSGPLTVRLTVTDDQGRQDSMDLVVVQASSGGGGGGSMDLVSLLALAMFAGATRLRRQASLTWP